MEKIIVIYILFSIILIIIILLLIVYLSRNEKDIDYNLIINKLIKEKQEFLLDLDNGNKKINLLEKEIFECKKKLGYDLTEKKK